LFLRFLSLRDEWARVKRTGRRTPINEKTTFTTVFPKDKTIPCFWDSWAWAMSGWGWRGQEGGHQSMKKTKFATVFPKDIAIRYLVFEIPQPERRVGESEKDRKEDTGQWNDDICNRLSKRNNNTLFLRFLSLRDEWMRVKRTGRRTPIKKMVRLPN
jgi:hypothetical protein